MRSDQSHLSLLDKEQWHTEPLILVPAARDSSPEQSDNSSRCKRDSYDRTHTNSLRHPHPPAGQSFVPKASGGSNSATQGLGAANSSPYGASGSLED
ncbi:hypothetical protein E2C01_051046 [Portunus trituberculatus]|uniref:Uncharacterized protein n=1 Tax=Portunus trituberculatus TaxID=210409 RepID=A0A5B7GKQ9_PORTR|nr:hypothetical protein [Portunus trituberculatus]